MYIATNLQPLIVNNGRPLNTDEFGDRVCVVIGNLARASVIKLKHVCRIT